MQRRDCLITAAGAPTPLVVKIVVDGTIGVRPPFASLVPRSMRGQDAE